MNTNAQIHQSETENITPDKKIRIISKFQLVISFLVIKIIASEKELSMDLLQDHNNEEEHQKLPYKAMQYQQLIGFIELIFTMALILYLQVIFTENNILKYISNIYIVLTMLIYILLVSVYNDNKPPQQIEEILRFIFRWTYYITNSLFYISCISMLLLTFIIIMIIKNKITINYNIFYHLAIMAFAKFIVHLLQLIENKISRSIIRTHTVGPSDQGSLYQFKNVMISFVTFAAICGIIIYSKLKNAHIIIITIEDIISMMAIISLLIFLIMAMACQTDFIEQVTTCTRIMVILFILQSIKQSIVDQYKLNIAILVIIATVILLQLTSLCGIISMDWLGYMAKANHQYLYIITHAAIKLYIVFYMNINNNIMDIVVIIAGLCFSMQKNTKEINKKIFILFIIGSFFLFISKYQNK